MNMLAEINRIAKLTSDFRLDKKIMTQDAFIEAWEGAAIALAENPDATEYELIGSSLKYINRFAAQYHNGRQVTKRTLMYWERHFKSRLPDVLTPMALATVMEQLPAKHREILLHAAEYDSQREAAKALGWPEPTFAVAFRKAAAAARELWFDWETPPKRSGGYRRTRTHCPHGHAFTSENTGWGRTQRGTLKRYCKACKRERRRAQIAREQGKGTSNG